jgi:hypothetical protein
MALRWRKGWSRSYRWRQRQDDGGLSTGTAGSRPLRRSLTCRQSPSLRCGGLSTTKAATCHQGHPDGWGWKVSKGLWKQSCHRGRRSGRATVVPVNIEPNCLLCKELALSVDIYQNSCGLMVFDHVAYMATQEQVEANRQNAQKSTGPRTAEGKMAVALNAVKHGLTANIDVVCQEDQAGGNYTANSAKQSQCVGAMQGEERPHKEGTAPACRTKPISGFVSVCPGGAGTDSRRRAR